MDPMIATSTLGAFLPTKDFDTSRRFYEALGFVNRATGEAGEAMNSAHDESFDGSPAAGASAKA